MVKNNLQDPGLWESLFSCYISWASPWLSFHNCNYDILFPGVRTARGRSVFTSAVGRCTLPVSWRRCWNPRSIFSYDIDHDSVVWIPCISTNSTTIYACRSIRRVYSVTIRSFFNPVLQCIFWEFLKMHFIVANEKHTLNMCCPIWRLCGLCGMKLTSHI